MEIDAEALGMERGDSLVDRRGDRRRERSKEAKLVFIDTPKHRVSIAEDKILSNSKKKKKKKKKCFFFLFDNGRRRNAKNLKERELCFGSVAKCNEEDHADRQRTRCNKCLCGTDKRHRS